MINISEANTYVPLVIQATCLNKCRPQRNIHLVPICRVFTIYFFVSFDSFIPFNERLLNSADLLNAIQYT